MNKFLLFFLFLPALATSQSDAGLFAAVPPNAAASFAPNTVAITTAHTRRATEQLYTHVAENLNYPTQKAVQGLEGEVTATFTVAPDGAISKVHISATELPRPFGKELIATIKALKKVNFTGPAFRGSETFHLPVRFSY